jgi:hypothetical protein
MKRKSKATAKTTTKSKSNRKVLRPKDGLRMTRLLVNGLTMNGLTMNSLTLNGLTITAMWGTFTGWPRSARQ